MTTSTEEHKYMAEGGRKTCKEMVTEFHRANGAVIAGKDLRLEVAVLRMRLIVEEFAETCIALHTGNVIEAADGLVDLLYVIYGAAVTYDVECQDCTSMSGKTPINGTFNPSAVLRFMCTMLLLLRRTCDAIAVAPLACGPELSRLMAEVCTFGVYDLGFPMRELFEEVHRSNMTKTFSPQTNTAGGKYGAGSNPKGPNYRPPDISGILFRHGWQRAYGTQGKPAEQTG